MRARRQDSACTLTENKRKGWRRWRPAASRRERRVRCMALRVPRNEGVAPRPPRAAALGLVRPARAAPLAESVPGEPHPSSSSKAPAVADGNGTGGILHCAPRPPVAPFDDPGDARGTVARQHAAMFACSSSATRAAHRWLLLGRRSSAASKAPWNKQHPKDTENGTRLKIHGHNTLAAA